MTEDLSRTLTEAAEESVVHESGNADHLGDAMHWLLESRHVSLDAKDHFWHIADGAACDCEVAGRV